MSEIISVELGGFAEYSISTQFGRSLRGIGRVKGWLEWGLTTENGDHFPVAVLDVFVFPTSTEKPNTLYVTDKGEDELGQLTCYADESLFNLLKEPSVKTVAVTFSVKNSVRTMDANAFRSDLLQLHIHIQEHRTINPENDAIAVSKDDVQRFAAGQYTQVNDLAKELLYSYEEQASRNIGVRKARSAYISQIGYIFSELRGAVARGPSLRPILNSEIEQFREHVSTLDQKAADDLIDAYDNIWKHRKSATVIASGKIDPEESGELIVEMVEEAAKYYVGSKLVSLRLEQLLIDALLFAETIAYARTVPYWPSNLRMRLVKGLGQAVGFCFSEGFALLVTAIIAKAIDEQQGLAYWIVFSAITIVRWLRPNEARQEKVRTIRLMIEMSSAQGRLGHMHFNPRLLRELLFDLEKKGAVFSPVVYNLLDKRIARDDAALVRVG